MTTILTPSQIQMRQNISNALLQSGLGGQARSPLGALSQMGQTLAGAFISNRAQQAQQQRNQAAQQALLALTGGQQPAGTAVAGLPPGVNPMGTPPIAPTGPAGPQMAPGGGPGGGAPGGANPPPPGIQRAATGAGGAPGTALGQIAARSQPSMAALLQTAQQFPEIAGMINPLIAARMKPITPVVASAGSQVINPQTGQVVATVPQAAGRVQIREIADPTSPTGTRFVEVEEAVGQPGPPKSEFSVQTVTDPATGETRTIMARGVGAASAGGGDLTSTTESSLQKGIAQGTQQLERLNQIAATMEDDFLTLPTQVANQGLAAFERLGGTLNPEQRQGLQRFTRARSTTIRNLNRTLNELSGAAVSPAEAERLKAEGPSMSDSPSQFRAKMNATREAIEASIRRNQQLLDQGVQNLQFNRAGEVTNAPDLETFMMIEPRGEMEAGMASEGAAAEEAQGLLNADLSTMTPAQLEEWNQRMDAMGM